MNSNLKPDLRLCSVAAACLSIASTLYAGIGHANTAPANIAAGALSATNANPALPRPTPDPTTQGGPQAASAVSKDDEIGADGDAPPPGSTAGTAAAEPAAPEDIGADAEAPPPSAAAATTTLANSAGTAAPASGTTAPAAGDEHPNRSARHEPAPWWGPGSYNRFGVEYVAQAAGQKALVIRFSREVSVPDAGSHIKLLAKNGQAVDTRWQAGADARELLAPDLAPGRYTLTLDPQLASTGGESLGEALEGPTYIR